MQYEYIGVNAARLSFSFELRNYGDTLHIALIS